MPISQAYEVHHYLLNLGSTTMKTQTPVYACYPVQIN